MDLSSAALRVLVGVAERGSFTAAAAALGYTQSGISRQVAAAERAAGARLFDRSALGVRPTAAGRVLLHQAVVVLDALDAAERQISGGTAPRRVRRVRVGHVPTAGAHLVPAALAQLGRSVGDLTATTREGSSPALLRALRAGSLDLAVITTRPPHRSPDQDPTPVQAVTLADIRLAVAVPTHGPVAEALRTARGPGGTVAADALARQPWVGSPSRADEPLLGIWPGLPGAPRVRYQAQDWTTKMALVAAGLGVTTVAGGLGGAVPPGVEVLDPAGVVAEVRRVSAVHAGDRPTPAVAAVLTALAAAAVAARVGD